MPLLSRVGHAHHHKSPPPPPLSPQRKWPPSMVAFNTHADALQCMVRKKPHQRAKLHRTRGRKRDEICYFSRWVQHFYILLASRPLFTPKEVHFTDARWNVSFLFATWTSRPHLYFLYSPFSIYPPPFIPARSLSSCHTNRTGIETPFHPDSGYFARRHLLFNFVESGRRFVLCITHTHNTHREKAHNLKNVPILSLISINSDTPKMAVSFLSAIIQFFFWGGGEDDKKLPLLLKKKWN